MFLKLRRWWLVGWVLSVTLLSLGTVHAHWFYLLPLTLMENDHANEVVETPLMFDLPATIRLRLNEEFRVPAVKCKPHWYPVAEHRVG